jgi:hypothetical protein
MSESSLSLWLSDADSTAARLAAKRTAASAAALLGVIFREAILLVRPIVVGVVGVVDVVGELLLSIQDDGVVNFLTSIPRFILRGKCDHVS